MESGKWFNTGTVWHDDALGLNAGKDAAEDAVHPIVESGELVQYDVS